MATDTNKPRDPHEETVTFSGPLPERIGEYQLVRMIGSGGMGVVYEALHLRLKRRVAIKLLAQGHAGRPTAWKRFAREVEAAGKLEHPHVVHATDAGEVQGIPYLVMEFVEGADLSRVVRQYGPLPPLAALDVLQQAGDALGYIHSQGLVHRDIKPSNLLVDKWGTVKVADLGVAQLLQPEPGSEEITTDGVIVGTVDYMSPEQAGPHRRIDHRADLYSLGCCLYFLLSGDPVFHGETRLERLIAHRVAETPPLPCSRGMQLPESIARLFADLLSKDPAQRPPTVGAFLTRLAQCREHILQALREGKTPDPLCVGERLLPAEAGIQDVARAVFAGESRSAADAGTLAATSRLDEKPKRQVRRAAFGIVFAMATVVLVFVWKGVFDTPRPLRQGIAASSPTENDPLKGQAGGSQATDSGQSSEGEESDPEQQSSPEKEFGPPDLRRDPVTLRGHQGAVFCVRFSPDGEFVVSASSDTSVRVWRLANLEPVHVLRDHGNQVLSLDLIPETDLLVSSSFTGSAFVWNWRTGSREREVPLHRVRTEGVAFVRDDLILSSGLDDDLVLWHSLTGAIDQRLANAHQGGVRALAVDRSGRYAVTGDYQGNLAHWDLERRSLVAMLQPIAAPISIWSLDWGSHPTRIAIGGKYLSGEMLLLVYDLERKQIVCQFRGDSNRVNAVRLSRDGRRVYSAGESVRGWSLEPPAELFEFQEHIGEVFAVDESPDGELIVSGGVDGTVRLRPISASLPQGQ
ncbi:MAG: protein kinase domain-containing protein [Planctomycetales bacterium]